MKFVFFVFLGTGSKARRATEPIRFENQKAFDFAETQSEKEGNWSLENRCSGVAVAGGKNDQRNDVTCPNVLLINTSIYWNENS